jgi:hypothetical protein
VATARIRVVFFEAVDEPTVGILVRDRLGNDVYGTNTYHQGVATGRWKAGETLEVRFEFPLALGVGDYAITAAVHSLGVHVFQSYDWLDAGLAFQVLPSDDRQSIGVARLEPRIAVETGPRPDALADVLARAVGTLPSELDVPADGEPFLCAGWYGVEGAGADAFRWTEGECRFLLAVDGHRLCLEVAADRPAQTPPVSVSLLALDREIGSVRVLPTGAWQVVSLLLPDAFPRGPARFRLRVDHPWRPADGGASDDTRVLGVRVRRIWCDDTAARDVG